MNAHTPTPWTVTRNSVDQWNVEVGDSELRSVIARCWDATLCPEHKGTAQSNAEFITRAVNSHDALLAALRECVTEEGAAGLQEGLGRMKRRILAINDIARAAIAQAAGNEGGKE